MTVKREESQNGRSVFTAGPAAMEAPCMVHGIPMTDHILCAQHGIRTPRRAVTFPERLEAHVAFSEWANIDVLTDQYDAGAHPRINMLFKNQRIAKAQAEIIDYWMTIAHERTNRELTVSFLGHSNGCDIVRWTAIELHKRGRKINALIMIAAPLPTTIEKQKLKPLVDAGTVIENWHSDGDKVLAADGAFFSHLIRWPYGNAGRVGLRDADADVLDYTQPGTRARVINRKFDWGHSDYFLPGNEKKTFNVAIKRIQAIAAK